MDVGVAIRGPAFAAPGSAGAYSIDVTDYAYDVGLGIVVTTTLPPNSRFGSASGSGWNCSQSRGIVTCAAETIPPGNSPIAITLNAPSSGTARFAASVESIGTIDPNTKNDSATFDTAIYDPASCVAATPRLLSPADDIDLASGSVDLEWTPAAGASQYRVWSAVEGAAATILAETAAPRIRRDAEVGRTEWWVEAIFAACPALASEHRHFVSHGSAALLDVATLAAGFQTPASVGADLDGNIYVVDSETSTLHRIAADGTVSTPAGVAGQHGSSDGPPGLSTLNHPRALAVTPGGYVYIADTDNHTIRQFFPTGNGAFLGAILVRIAGGSLLPGIADANGGNARFDHPSGIAVAANGSIFVADAGSDLVRQLGGLSLDVSTVAGKSRELDDPTGIALHPNGSVFVADTNHHVIRKIAPDGTVTTFAGIAAGFNSPTALAFDALGNLYVADTGNNAIRRIAPSGFVSTVVAAGILVNPTGIAFDASGRLLIADAGNHVIRIATRAVASTPPASARKRAVRH